MSKASGHIQSLLHRSQVTIMGDAKNRLAFDEAWYFAKTMETTPRLLSASKATEFFTTLACQLPENPYRLGSFDIDMLLCTDSEKKKDYLMQMKNYDVVELVSKRLHALPVQEYIQIRRELDRFGIFTSNVVKLPNQAICPSPEPKSDRKLITMG